MAVRYFTLKTLKPIAHNH